MDFWGKVGAGQGFGCRKLFSPEICVEVKSPHNTWKKLYEKAQLYFEQSALEVWFCNEQGEMTFTNLDGLIQHSGLAPTFPQQLEM